jgi:undecaprenyl-phosphate 4-deoxy-4-formamido-L-arabinose transferase
MDEDLQHSPASLFDMRAKLEEDDLDVVYGKYEARRHSGFRNSTSRLLARLLAWGIPDLNPDYTSLRLLRASIAKHTLVMRNSYTFLDGYLTWVTSRSGSVQVEHAKSQSGPSAYTFKKLMEHSINIFVTFSNLPIRLLTYFAIGFFMLSAVYSVNVIVRSLLYDDYLAGFPTLIVLIGFGFGFTLLGLGIIGEYIQRINLKTTNRPNYTVKESVG